MKVLYTVLACALLLLFLQMPYCCNSITIQDLALNAETCAVIRNTAGATIPCECRLNTGKLRDPNPCYPSCCPKTETFEGDWCHKENRLQWSVYDQLQCVEAPAAIYVDDSVNCFDQGTIPHMTSVVAREGVTELGFELSRRLVCDDLYIAPCKTDRVYLQDFRVNTTDSPPRECWLSCAPSEVEACSSYSCWAHRGRTASTVKTWTLQRQLPSGDYALVCKTLVSAAAVTHVLYQYAAASAYFRVD